MVLGRHQRLGQTEIAEESVEISWIVLILFRFIDASNPKSRTITLALVEYYKTIIQ